MLKNVIKNIPASEIERFLSWPILSILPLTEIGGNLFCKFSLMRQTIRQTSQPTNKQADRREHSKKESSQWHRVGSGLWFSAGAQTLGDTPSPRTVHSPLGPGAGRWLAPGEKNIGVKDVNLAPFFYSDFALKTMWTRRTCIFSWAPRVPETLEHLKAV